MRFDRPVVKVGFCVYLAELTRDKFVVEAIDCRKTFGRGNVSVLRFWRNSWKSARNYGRLQKKMADRGLRFSQVRGAIEQQLYQHYKNGLIQGDPFWSKFIWINDGDGYTLRRRWTTERSE